MYLPMNVSMTRKCSQAKITISSLENKSTTTSGVGICEPNVTRTSSAFGINRIAYEATNGKTQTLTSPTNLLVMSCFGRNHIKTHKGNMNSEENQKVIEASSTLSPRYLIIQFFYNTLYEIRWEFQRWTLVSTGQIHKLPPSRYPTAPMAPGRAAPFPA